MGHFWQLVGFGTLIYWDRDSIAVLYDSSVLNFLNITIWQITPLLKQQKIKITLKLIKNKLEMSMKTFLNE